jgi:hypothetical protein
MSMADLEKALSLIASQPDADFEGPKPESLIAKAEQALSFSFPPTYRAFLLKMGCGDVAGVEIYGVINDDFENSETPDAIWLTLKERLDAALPDDLIIVSELGDGSFDAIDMGQRREDGEAAVITWMPGADNDRSKQVIAEDFGAFHLKKLEGAL